MIKTYHTDENEFLAERSYTTVNNSFSSLTRIIVDEAMQFQKMLGFGIAVTDASCYILNKLDKTMRESIIKDVFTPEGLNLGLARISVAASDYSAECFSYNDTVDDVEMRHFLIEHDRAYVLPILKEIINKREDLFLLSSTWSPPGWMKTGGEMCGGWLRSQYIDAYVNYYLRFLQAYKENGIHISALTAQNEVETDQVSRMPACLLHPEQEMEFITKLFPLLIKHNLDTKIWMLDHNYIHWNRVKWMLDDKDFRQLVDGVAFHYYEGNAQMLSLLHDHHSDKGFHITEGGPDIGEDYEKQFCDFSLIISKAINNWCSSVTGWNLILDENGYPNIGPYRCAGLITYNTKTGEIIKSGHYKAYAHYSRFIQKGSIRIYTGCVSFGQDSNADRKIPVYSVGFLNPDGSIVLVLTNPGEKDEVTVSIRNEIYRIPLKANSICTVVFK